MSGPNDYLSKAKACADAANEALDPSDRVELLQVSRCFVLLAEHAAGCRRHGTQRQNEQRATLSRLDCFGSEVRIEPSLSTR